MPAAPAVMVATLPSVPLVAMVYVPLVSSVPTMLHDTDETPVSDVSVATTEPPAVAWYLLTLPVNVNAGDGMVLPQAQESSIAASTCKVVGLHVMGSHCAPVHMRCR